jgi:cbb3-type cytochrome oxidase subunit 3
VVTTLPFAFLTISLTALQAMALYTGIVHTVDARFLATIIVFLGAGLIAGTVDAGLRRDMPAFCLFILWLAASQVLAWDQVAPYFLGANNGPIFLALDIWAEYVLVVLATFLTAIYAVLYWVIRVAARKEAEDEAALPLLSDFASIATEFAMLTTLVALFGLCHVVAIPVRAKGSAALANVFEVASGVIAGLVAPLSFIYCFSVLADYVFFPPIYHDAAVGSDSPCITLPSRQQLTRRAVLVTPPEAMRPKPAGAEAGAQAEAETPGIGIGR